MSLYQRIDTGEVRDISPEIMAALSPIKQAMWQLYTPPAPVVVIPSEVPAWSLKAVAKLAGLESAIEAALAQLQDPERTVATLAWTDGNFIQRDSPLLVQFAAALGLTSAQVDAMFLQANALEV